MLWHKLKKCCRKFKLALNNLPSIQLPILTQSQRFCLLVTEKQYFHKTKKRFYTTLNSLPFWSKQTTKRWRSLCSCVLWSFLSFKTTWSDLFPALWKVPWFFAIGWQMGKTGFYLSVIFPQAFFLQAYFVGHVNILF